MPNAYAIMPVGKNDRSAIGTQTKTPTAATVGVYYSVLEWRSTLEVLNDQT